MLMKLILGLGNIGSQYTRTRHNIGFRVVDTLATELDATWKPELKFKAEVAEGHGPKGERLILAKPHTMMNLSGEAAMRIAQFYKIKPADIWVVFDDVDTPFGRVRIRQGGSGSGHQGVNSIISHLGADFLRIKVGISLNDRATEPSEVYVLRPFNPDEQTHLPALLDATVKLIHNQLERDQPEQSTFSLL